MKAYIDRFEDDKFAVILIEETNQQFQTRIDSLPPGSTERMWLDVRVKDNEIVELKLDLNTTKLEKQKTQELLTKIRSKNKGSKFKNE